MKIRLLLFFFCLWHACSPNDFCVNKYYVYVYEGCSCPPPCKAQYFISESIANCLTELLSESDSSCVFVDESVCSGITFSGYIFGINTIQDCLDNSD